MIQRIQSVYLFLAALLSGIVIFFASLWVDNNNEAFFAVDAFKSSNVLLKIAALLFFLSALVSLYTIFKFKNRQLQFVLGRINILTNFILLGILVYFSQNLSGETVVSMKGIGLLIPVFTIALVALANKAIKKDEELVKSVDRLR
jgi:hypothetical protein